MLLTRALNIRMCQVEQKTIIIQIEIIRREILYEVNGINTKTFEWMYPDRWVVLYQAIDKAVRSGALQHDKDWTDTVRVGEWTRAFVKNDSARAKKLCRLLEMSNQRDYRNILAVRCALHYDESEDRDQVNNTPFTEASEELESLVGFVENQNEYVPVHSTNGHDKAPSYTPSVKTKPTATLAAGDESDEESYRPLPLSDTSTEAISQTPSPPAPVYRAAPPATESSIRKRKKHITEAEKLIDSLSVEAESNRARRKAAARVVYVSPKRSYRKRSETESETGQVTPNKAEESDSGGRGLSVGTTNRPNTKQKATISETVKAKHRELFGLDDDEDEHGGTVGNGKGNEAKADRFKKPSPIAEPKHSKHKRKLKDLKKTTKDEEQEKKEKTINEQWLSKLNTEDKQKKLKLTKTKSQNGEQQSDSEAQATETSSEPTKEPKDDPDEDNHFCNLTVPRPPKVDKLTLEEMSAKDILKTFDYYKPVLDAIFMKAKHKDYVRNWEGVNHFLVMNLTERSTQMELMQKLGQEYEPRSAGPSAYVTLFSNAMMPEWLVHLVMAKYKMTRSEALEHLQALENYRLHVESENNKHYYL